jgi:tetratricopeptide (TPR) repeat protein
MKRGALIVAVIAIASLAVAQGTGKPTQNPPSSGQATQGGQPTQGAQPAQGQTPPGGQASPGAQPTPPAGKRPPQAKTQPEFDAYKAAVANTDPSALEKASDDFATKFPDSELRILLYKTTMRMYQNANNLDKTEAMGRKVLALDADDPEALVMVAEVIAEKTHDSDLDKEQRYDEATKMAQKATETVDTDVSVPAGTPPEKLEAYKNLLRSNAYSILGTIEFKKDNFAAAQTDLQKSIDAYPSQPDPVVVLRLALSMDRQQKYPDALKIANRAVDLTQENSQIGTLARRERDRLQQLTGGAPPATQPAQNQPPQNQPPQN